MSKQKDDETTGAKKTNRIPMGSFDYTYKFLLHDCIMNHNYMTIAQQHHAKTGVQPNVMQLVAAIKNTNENIIRAVHFFQGKTKAMHQDHVMIPTGCQHHYYSLEGSLESFYNTRTQNLARTNYIDDTTLNAWKKQSRETKKFLQKKKPVDIEKFYTGATKPDGTIDPTYNPTNIPTLKDCFLSIAERRQALMATSPDNSDADSVPDVKQEGAHPATDTTTKQSNVAQNDSSNDDSNSNRKLSPAEKAAADTAPTRNKAFSSLSPDDVSQMQTNSPSDVTTAQMPMSQTFQQFMTFFQQQMQNNMQMQPTGQMSINPSMLSGAPPATVTIPNTNDPGSPHKTPSKKPVDPAKTELNAFIKLANAVVKVKKNDFIKQFGDKSNIKNISSMIQFLNAITDRNMVIVSKAKAIKEYPQCLEIEKTLETALLSVADKADSLFIGKKLSSSSNKQAFALVPAK